MSFGFRINAKIGKSVCIALATVGIASGVAWAEGDPAHVLGPLVWTDPAPGAYELRAQGSDLCVTRETGSTIFQEAHLVLRPCNANLAGSAIELAPAAAIDPATANRHATIANASFIVWRITNREQCITSARNVVFGAPAVDVIPCSTQRRADGAVIERGGEPDQLWRLVRSGPGQFAFLGSERRCWTAQGSVLRDGVQLVMEPCDNRFGQTFEISTRMGGVSGDVNDASAREFGWVLLRDGGTGAIDRFRSLRGMNLPSGDYTAGVATANDEGRACATLCARDAQCKGFTWVNPAVRAGTAMCYKKNVLNAPTADPMTMSGVVRP